MLFQEDDAVGESYRLQEDIHQSELGTFVGIELK